MLLLDLPGKTLLQLLSFWIDFSFFPTSEVEVFKFRNLFSRAKQQKQEIQEPSGAYRFCHKRSGVILIG